VDRGAVRGPPTGFPRSAGGRAAGAAGGWSGLRANVL